MSSRITAGNSKRNVRRTNNRPRAAAEGSAPVRPPVTLPAKVTSVEGVTEYRLDNGLTILLFPEASKPTITVNVTYKVGSRCENYGETGMAHLLEHLMFKGSHGHPNIPQELSSHGAHANGTTSLDRTNYFETFQANEENLKWALDLEADRMVHSFIARKDLQSEMTVVRNELESGENDVNQVLYQRVLSTAYLWHNYGKCTTGSRSDIENVPIDRLQAFWRTYYQPDNAVLVVAGRFDESRTLAQIHETFGKIPRPTRVLPMTYTAEPSQDGERSVTLRRTGDLQALAVAYHVSASSHPDAPAVEILAQVLGDMPSGRLYKALVETNLATTVSASFSTHYEPGFLLLSADVGKESSLDDAREAMIAAIEGVVANPPGAEEVERARSELLRRIGLTLHSPDWLSIELSDWIGAGDWRLFFLNRDRIRAITPEDVERVARTYLKSSNRTVGQFIPTSSPDRVEIPAAPDPASLMKDYRGDAAIEPGEAFDASPSNIDSRTTRQALPGGLNLALLPKTTRGSTVAVALTLRLSDEKSLVNREAATHLVGQMLARGTARHTRQQIEDEFARREARVSICAGAARADVSIQSDRKNLVPVLELVAECLREPVFPASEFDTLRKQQLAALEEGRGEPSQVASRAFQRHMDPFPSGDIRYTRTLDERIDDVRSTTLDDVMKFHRDFYGASNACLAVVGDFGVGEIEELSRGLFGSWKSPHPFARVTNPFQAVSAINQLFETPDKANAVVSRGAKPQPARRRPRLCGARARQRDDRGRVLELAPGDANPAGRGNLLQRRLGHSGHVARPIGPLAGGGHLRPGECRAARDGFSGRDRARPERRLRGQRDPGSQVRMAPVAADFTSSGLLPGGDAGATSVLEAHARLGGGPRGED